MNISRSTIDACRPVYDSTRMARITLADDWKDFRGRIGDAVIYSWRGIICMRGYVVPRNPDTPAQRERRQRFAAAVQCWQSLPALTRARWNAQKTGLRPTGYNLFMSEYMRCEGVPAVPGSKKFPLYSISASSLLHTRSAFSRAGTNEAVVYQFRAYTKPELALSG